MENLWYQLILTALTGLLGIVMAYISKWLKSKFDAQQLSTAKSIAVIVTQAMEQVGAKLGWSGSQKYAQAVAYFATLGSKVGINLDEAQIKALIESAVLILNAAWLDLDEPEVPPTPVP